MNTDPQAESTPPDELEEITFVIFDWERRCWQWDVCAEIVTDSESASDRVLDSDNANYGADE